MFDKFCDIFVNVTFSKVTSEKKMRSHYDAIFSFRLVDVLAGDKKYWLVHSLLNTSICESTVRLDQTGFLRAFSHFSVPFTWRWDIYGFFGFSPCFKIHKQLNGSPFVSSKFSWLRETRPLNGLFAQLRNKIETVCFKPCSGYYAVILGNRHCMKEPLPNPR